MIDERMKADLRAALAGYEPILRGYAVDLRRAGLRNGAVAEALATVTAWRRADARGTATRAGYQAAFDAAAAACGDAQARLRARTEAARVAAWATDPRLAAWFADLRARGLDPHEEMVVWLMGARE